MAKIEPWRVLETAHDRYQYASLASLTEAGLGDASSLPMSLKILLESVLRHYDGQRVTDVHVRELLDWANHRRAAGEVPFHPVRVILPDSSGIPLLADLAAMRDSMKALGGDVGRVNPQIPIDLIIDHSVSIEAWGRPDALVRNMTLELERNRERYQFLRWAQQAFERFRLIPPGNGILHQMNIEVLAQVVCEREEHGRLLAFPDAMVGMDSHTPMINGMGVLAWGIGGIEAAAAMLGEPMQIRVPDVVGVRLKGKLAPGVTTTDLVLTMTQTLRRKGVVAAFVEFCGPGVAELALPQRCTLANMSVEYGATVAYFPVDGQTLRFLELTGRSARQIALVEAYARAQGLWLDATTPEPEFSSVLEFDLSTVEPSLAGPRRPEDRVALAGVAANFSEALKNYYKVAAAPERAPAVDAASGNGSHTLRHGDVVIAAITSCTNSSNPSVMMAAGLLARNAVARGLRSKPWVKTSLAPGSRIATDYLAKAGLQSALDQLGFQVAGYGCTTCMGNSGPLDEAVTEAIQRNKLVVTAVLSGNRNFESRIHPHARANYLASPPLVVAYAIAGSVNTDLSREPLGLDTEGQPVFLRDIWPSDEEIEREMARTITPELYRERYAEGFASAATWNELEAATGQLFEWPAQSDYIIRPPFFDGQTRQAPPIEDIVAARPLLMLGNSVTTDHISPIGAIGRDSAAGKYLISLGVKPADFSFYGARRVNHEVMIRGTFANIQVRNEMVPGVEGGFTRHMPDGEVMSVYEAAMRYRQSGTPAVVVAGSDYGCGSSRDWAAKGTRLLGIRAVIAESFERIHRANLVGMGVLPLEFEPGTTRHTLGLTGAERFDIQGLTSIAPRDSLRARIHYADGRERSIGLRVRIDTAAELDWYRNGGVLNFVLLQMLSRAQAASV
jgi:aconitate hydratase